MSCACSVRTQAAHVLLCGLTKCVCARPARESLLAKVACQSVCANARTHHARVQAYLCAP
eukprot:1251577-Pleurochrysis_carterae.AAC.2